MVEPEKKGFYEETKKTMNILFHLDNSSDLEDTVRNLREENAKLLQLIRSRKYCFLFLAL